MKRLGPVLVLALALLLPSVTNADISIDNATNALREAAGLPTLTTDASATNLAAIRVRQLESNFAHPADWGPLFAYLPDCVTGAGENIAYRTTLASTTGTQFVDQWAASPPHLANILGGWDSTGSATYAASDGRTYAVQIFTVGCGRSDPPATTLPPTQTPSQAPSRAPVSAAPQPALLVLPNTATSMECLTTSPPHSP